VLRQHRHWLARRPRKPWAWLMGGLLHSRSMRLGAWAPFVVRRARYSQSPGRRLRRWLANDQIAVHTLYGPLLPQALSGWVEQTLYVALETSLLWHPSGMVRLAVLDRGRAVPRGWCVREHGSAAVAYDLYKALLEKANTLVPCACKVGLLADRGCTDTALRRHLPRLGWHFRLRSKAHCWIDRPGPAGFQGRAIALACGQARFWQGGWCTRKRGGPVPRAGARPVASDEDWSVISEEPPDLQRWEDYGLRFDSAEHCLADKSHGFPLASSVIRAANALERLCVVLAMPPLSLGAQGTSVVQRGKRRLVDPHGLRGASYVKLGWTWVRYALSRGDELLTSVAWRRAGAPEPAIACKRQKQRRPCRFAFAYQHAA
jgi:hypothetical protein